MIKLKHVKIENYKSIEAAQEFDVDPEVTVLVGKNESGKTAALEAMAKTNYFQDDPQFKYDTTGDYPRKHRKRYEKAGDVAVVTSCTYALDDALLGRIAEDVGKGTFTATRFTYEKKYDNSALVGGVTADRQKFFAHLFVLHGVQGKEVRQQLETVSSAEDIKALAAEAEDEAVKKFLAGIKKYFTTDNESWGDPIAQYIFRTWLKPHMPKFLYYDEYYALPSRIDIEDLESNSLEGSEMKTSKALFELADIDLKELKSSSNFERFVSELEATGNEITQQLFKYWTTNPDLRIRFQIDRQLESNRQVPILDIRVENMRHMVSLPLRNRSKGFNWFFSFIVWFSMIQEDRDNDYILLLDEPGLNLHASAQADLLRFIEDLASDYQIIYTTHSPFMVESSQLHRVRTLLDTKEGTRISDSVTERDPDTLFPLQAALGYDIAQNLFVSKRNLLVEGVADLVYLTVMSGILASCGRTGLADGITIVPVGGLDKVSTFISLLRGNKLDIACFLDSFTDKKGKQRLDDLVAMKIIREKNIRFAHEFAATAGKNADLEDMFSRDEYIGMFNAAFSELGDITVGGLDENLPRITQQVAKALGKDSYNHYRPASHLAQTGVKADFFSGETLDRFEKLFKAINKLF